MHIRRTCLAGAVGASLLLLPTTGDAAAPRPWQCRPALVSHQGLGSGHDPNTIPAFRYAAQHRKIRWIETDTFRTRDGRNVLIHDNNLRLATGKPGFVSNRTYANIRRNYRTWGGEVIPTFAQGIATIRRYPTDRMLVEVKEAQPMRQLVRTVKRARLTDRVWFYARDIIWVGRLAHRWPGLHWGWKAPRDAKAMMVDFVDLVTLPSRHVTRPQVRQWKREAVVFAREVPISRAAYRQARALGVHGSLIDRPAHYLKWCRRG